MAAIPIPVDQAEELRAFVWVDINPEGLYDAKEAGIILGLSGSPGNRQNQMYRIPEYMLPRYRVGPNGGRIRWLGRDLLIYREACRQGG